MVLRLEAFMAHMFSTPLPPSAMTPEAGEKQQLRTSAQDSESPLPTPERPPEPVIRKQTAASGAKKSTRKKK